MTDAWEMHPETGLNPEPEWRDRGTIIANLIRDKQALEQRVGELELAALNLRDNYQGAHEKLAESRAEVERLRSHLPSDAFLDLIERSSLGSAEVREASSRVSRDAASALVKWANEMAAREAAEDETRALRERLTALADQWEGEKRCNPDIPSISFHAIALRAALAASPAVDATPEPTPTPGAECTCAMTEASQRTCPLHGEDDWLTPAAEPQAEGGA